MDPVSTTASFFTILGVLVKSAEAAQKIWGSPDELQRLATDLSELSELVDRLSALTRHRAIRDDDLRSLEAPYAKLREAQKVFEERLSKRHSSNNPASRFRRRTWILQRARIRKVAKDVATVRAHLSTLLQSLAFSSVLGIQTIQDQQSHALTLVDGRVSQCQNLLHSLAQYQRSSTHEQTAMRLRLSGTIEASASNREILDLQGEAADIEDFLDCASQFSDSISEVIQFYTPSASLLDCPIATSRACYPEDYVIEGLLYARLACFSMVELSRTATARIEKYYILFAQGGRLWSRVTVTATTTTTLKSWEAASSFGETCYHTFPYLSESQLETILDQNPLYESVTNLSLEFRLSDAGDVTYEKGRSRVIEEIEDTTATYAPNYLRELEQRGVQ